MKNILNARLSPNYVTEDPNDFAAHVVSRGTITSDDLIQLLKEDGMEIKAATVKDIVTRYNNKSAEMVVSGYNVNTGLVYMRSVIKGVFYDDQWDPERHSVYVSINQGAALRSALTGTEVRILGTKGDAMQLFSITNMVTGNTEGKLGKGRGAEIKGSLIKIAGDNGKTGLFFTNTGTMEVLKLQSEFIILNEPSRIIIIVPDSLTAGEYELSVVTQFVKSTKLLKNPRSAVLPIPVVIE